MILYSIVLIWLLVHVLLEYHQRGALLRWTDERDEEFGRLFQAAWKLTVLPKTNPLSGFKQHGMLAKDAFMRADVLIPALDERLGALEIGLTAVTREAKALATWERAHPAPPRHYWQVRIRKAVAAAALAQEPTATTKQLERGTNV